MPRFKVDKRVLEVLPLFSHEMRIWMTVLMGRKRVRAAELAKRLPITYAGVQAHMQRFFSVELVKTEREGRKVFYSLRKDELATVLAQLAHQADVVKELKRALRQVDEAG